MELCRRACRPTLERRPYLSRDDVCSTDGYGVAAGASIAVLELERFPAISDIAVIGSIQEVSPARSSTPSGDLEIDLRRGPEQLQGVYPYTPVTVRVEEVLGVRPSPGFPSPSDVAPADQIQVTVIGGTYTARLTPEEPTLWDATTKLISTRDRNP